jgi:hypothetical protein
MTCLNDSAFSPIRSELPDSDRLADEINNLQMFLSNPKQPHNYIVQHLKTGNRFIVSCSPLSNQRLTML